MAVFVDLLQLGERELPGFVKPFAKPLFFTDGTPCGQPLDIRSLGVREGRIQDRRRTPTDIMRRE